MKVQFHCSSADGCRPIDLKLLAERFSGIKFDFAHCCHKENILGVMEECSNVYTDTSMFDDYLAVENCNGDVKSRIMFGSDFPAYHIVNGEGFAKEYRKRLGAAAEASMDMNIAFLNFLK
jgi:predicted TIM-barrel fold metal-dependent hydrolase